MKENFEDLNEYSCSTIVTKTVDYHKSKLEGGVVEEARVESETVSLIFNGRTTRRKIIVIKFLLQYNYCQICKQMRPHSAKIQIDDHAPFYAVNVTFNIVTISRRG